VSSEMARCPQMVRFLQAVPMLVLAPPQMAQLPLILVPQRLEHPLVLVLEVPLLLQHPPLLHPLLEDGTVVYAVNVVELLRGHDLNGHTRVRLRIA
jgi:hypothetical protein